MPPNKDISADRFPGGMDCRVGLLGTGLDRFRELTNMIVSHDNSIVYRPPCIKLNGQLDPLCQGLVQNNGQYFTLCRRGDVPVNTGDIASLVTVVYFDQPELCTSTWTLLDLKVFEKNLVAYIQHGFIGTIATSRTYLHSFDSLPNNPTYIADPAACWDWGLVGFPQWSYGSGTGIPGSWATFNPFITAAVEKVWSPTIDQNDAFSAIGIARVWNARAVDDIEKTGMMYYFVPLPLSDTTMQIAIPETFSDFSDYQRFAGYVLEGLNADGSWSKVQETTSAPNKGQWQLTGVTRTWSTVTVAAINYNTGVGVGPGIVDYRLMRFRLLVTPEVAITSGGVVQPPNETYTGDGSTIAFPSVQSYASFVGDGTQVSVNGNVKTPNYYKVSQTAAGLALVTFDNFHQVTSGSLTLGAIAAGTGYTSIPSVGISGGASGTGSSITVTGLTAVSATIAAGGSGYAVGNAITVVGGTFAPQATFIVSSVSGSTVTGVTLFGGGIYTAVPSNPAATTGLGTGLTLTIQYGVGTASIVGGNGWSAAPTASVTGGGGTGATIGIVLAAPVGLSTIPFAVAGDTDFGAGGAAVYYNGVLKHVVTDYTIVNVGGVASFQPNTALAIGTLFDARMIPPNGTLVVFSSPLAVVGAAVITYEAASQTTLEVHLSALTPSSSFLVGVAANGSSTLTKAIAVGGAQPSTVGVGYAIGDVLTIVGGTGTAATCTVATVSNNGVASVTMLTPGNYSVLPPTLATTSGGSGSGCVLQLSFIGTWTGLQRYQIYIQALVTTDSGGNITVSTPFQYGNLALTLWYVNRHQKNLDYWSGASECGSINTSTHDTSGGNIVTQIAIKNRMLLCYAQTTQLWSIDPNPNNNAFLDSYAFGATGEMVNFYSMAMVSTQMGFLNFDLQGINFQALLENNVGLPVQSLGQFTVHSAVFYPQRGAYLAFVTIVNSQKYAAFAELPEDSPFWASSLTGFMWLTFTKESAIGAWSFFQVAGLTNVTRMISQNAKIYCLQGQQIWSFDDLATIFKDGAKDANGLGTVVYRGDSDWSLVPLAEGSVRMIHMDMVKTGIVSVSTSIMPWNAGQEVPGPTLRSVTMGRLRVPLRCTGRAIGARVVTTDPLGTAIKSIRFEYKPLGR